MKNVDFEVGFTDKGAKAGFDGIDVSAKELQTRIAQLDATMDKLTKEFGKNAYTMKAGIIAQRERGIALSQLIALEEKHAIATGRSVRGLGSLGSAAMAASGSISGLGTGISVLSNALMSGVGLTAGLAAAVAGFSLLMEHIRDTNAEMTKYKNQISAMLDIAGPGGNFKVNPEQLDSMIASLQTKIDAYRNAKKTSEGTKGSFEFQNIKFQEALIGVLQDANIKYKEQQAIINGLKQEGYVFTEKEKDKTKAVKEHTKSLEALVNPLKMLIDLYKKLNEQELPAGMVNLPRSGSFKMNTVPVPSKPLINITDQEFARQNEQWIEGIYATLDIMRSGFNEAWEDILGEANSMFEKMIASWADVFLNAFSKKAMGWLLDLIPGGGLISDFLGLGGNKPIGEGRQNIYLQVDKTVFAKVVLDAGNRANKLRL